MSDEDNITKRKCVKWAFQRYSKYYSEKSFWSKLNYSKHYSEKGFWNKLKKCAIKAVRKCVELALQLYYALQSPETPNWAKIVITGPLGYFILPLDAIPDFSPIVGFTDDFGVLVLAVRTVAGCITDEMKDKAKHKVNELFGEEENNKGK